MSVETRRAEREPKTETEKALQAQKAKEGLKAMAIGPVTGVLGLPSDIIDLADMANDAIAKYGKDTTIAQFSKLIKPQLDRLQEKYGREQFDKGFTELTGIKSDVSRPAQMLGELISLGGLAKAGVKGAKVIGESISDAYKGTEKLFETQTDLLTKGPTGGSGGVAVETAGVGQLDQTKKLLKDEQKAITTEAPTTIPPEEFMNAPRELEKTGKYNQDELFDLTRVYRGEDGKFRWEIDTTDARLKLDTFINKVKNANNDQQVSLYNFLKFDRLYQEYPNMMQSRYTKLQPIRNIKVNIKRKADSGDGSNAFYDVEEDSITLNLDNIKEASDDIMMDINSNAILENKYSNTINFDKVYKTKLESTLLHEIQHAIQQREGFIQGSNTAQFLPVDFQKNLKRYQKKFDTYNDYVVRLLKKNLATKATDGRQGGYNAEELKVIENIAPFIKSFNDTYSTAPFKGTSEYNVNPDTLMSTALKALEQGEETYAKLDKVLRATKGQEVAQNLSPIARSAQYLFSKLPLPKETIYRIIDDISKESRDIKEGLDFFKKQKAEAYNKYKNVYGEREARLVQDRFAERLAYKDKNIDKEDIQLIMGSTKIPEGMRGISPVEQRLQNIKDRTDPVTGKVKPKIAIPSGKIKDEGLSPVQKKLKEIDYMGADVFHATTKDFKTFGFVSKNNQADIGFHVGKPNQASARVDGDSAKLGARTLPLKLKRELKPARIPDLGSFKEPSNWLRNIAFTDKDPLFRVINDTPEGRASIKKQIEDNIPLKMGDKTYYMLPDLMKGSVEDIGFKNKTIDKGLWKDLVLESTRAIRIGLDTTKNFKDRQEWFDTIKKVANKNGYDSYVYRNEYEGQVFDTLTGTTKRDDSFMLLEPDQAKGRFGGMTKGEPDFMKSQGGLLLSEGGKVMKKQMELFEEGGLKDEGNTVDPVSGNDVPPGATQEEVRDDIPARLSEGEFVFPADVVRYWGLETLMKMRQEAKAGLARMEAMGQMGNSDEAIIPDDAPFNPSQEDLPFTMDDLDTEEEMEYNEGGVVKAQTGTFVQPSQFQGQPLPSSGTMPNYVAPNIPPPVPAPVGGFTPQFTAQTGQAGQQTTVPTFQTLLGTTPGQYDEMREYVNEAGAKLRIPFKDGQPIYPIPEGYSYVDPEATKTEEVTTKEVTPQTTQVTQIAQEGDSALDDRVKQENVENYGVEDPTVISLGGYIDKTDGSVKDSMEFSYNVTPEGGFFSTSLPMSFGKSLASLVTGRSMVGDKDIVTLTPKGYPDVKIELNGKDFKDMVNIKDDKGNIKQSITNKNVQNFIKNRVNREIQRKDISKRAAGATARFKSGEVVDAGDLTKKSMQQYMQDLGVDEGIQAGSSDDFRSDDNYDDTPEASSFGGQPEPSMGDVGESEDDDAPEYNQAKGGLLGKKKPKVKKMKRGGLASR